MNKELLEKYYPNLIKYYEEGDCCSGILKLRKEIDVLHNINKQLVEECQRLNDEETRLNNIINQADTKNLELIQKINKIYDVIENKNITGIEARLLIRDILDKEE